MAERSPSAEPTTATSGPPSASTVKPLTRHGYKRLEGTERQICDALGLDKAELGARASQRDEGGPDFLSAEALVYFIRRAVKEGDARTRDLLFHELLERCIPFFRGKFGAFDAKVQEELQQEVLSRLIEDLLATDDRGDFAQVRFWSYLTKKAIDAYRKAFKHADDTESLDSGYTGDGENEGKTKLERQTDSTFTPEQWAQLSEGLRRLPEKLRQVFILRHRVGLNIGSDTPDLDDPQEPTLARHFGVTGRTIRTWLRQAEDLLADYQGTGEVK